MQKTIFGDSHVFLDVQCSGVVEAVLVRTISTRDLSRYAATCLRYICTHVYAHVHTQGKPIHACGSSWPSTKYCPNAKTLADMQTMSIWAEVECIGIADGMPSLCAYALWCSFSTVSTRALQRCVANVRKTISAHVGIHVCNHVHVHVDTQVRLHA